MVESEVTATGRTLNSNIYGDLQSELYMEVSEGSNLKKMQLAYSTSEFRLKIT